MLSRSQGDRADGGAWNTAGWARTEHDRLHRQLRRLGHRRRLGHGGRHGVDGRAARGGGRRRQLHRHRRRLRRRAQRATGRAAAPRAQGRAHLRGHQGRPPAAARNPRRATRARTSPPGSSSSLRTSRRTRSTCFSSTARIPTCTTGRRCSASSTTSCARASCATTASAWRRWTRRLRAIRHPGVQSVQIIFNMFRLKPADRVLRRRARAPGRDPGPRAIGQRPPHGQAAEADSTFAADDHRGFNRNGERFDKGETFSGVPYDVGLQAVDELRPLLPTGATPGAARAALDPHVPGGHLHHPRRRRRRSRPATTRPPPTCRRSASRRCRW